MCSADGENVVLRDLLSVYCCNRLFVSTYLLSRILWRGDEFAWGISPRAAGGCHGCCGRREEVLNGYGKD